MKVWNDWTACRRNACPGRIGEWPIHLYLAQPQQMNYWLCKFVLETRKANGEFYPPNTLYSLCCGLLRYIRERKPELNIFKDPSYNGFQKTLDSEMKRLTSLGVGVKRHQAEPITVDEENRLWELRLLGDHSPQALLDTMVYLNGMNIAWYRAPQLTYIPVRVNPD